MLNYNIIGPIYNAPGRYLIIFNFLQKVEELGRVAKMINN